MGPKEPNFEDLTPRSSETLKAELDESIENLTPKKTDDDVIKRFFQGVKEAFTPKTESEKETKKFTINKFEDLNEVPKTTSHQAAQDLESEIKSAKNPE